MVMRTFLDSESGARYDKFKNIIRRDEDPNDNFSLMGLFEKTPENEADRNILIDQINSYELSSLGIRRGIFDEAFYKLWFHRQFTKDFESVQPYIKKVQAEKSPSVYCEFCALYERWMRNKHPVANPNRFKMAYWAITKNHAKLHASQKK